MKQTIKVNGAAVEQAHGQDDPLAPIPATPRIAPRELGTATKRAGAEPYDALLWRLQARQTPETARTTTLGLIGCERRVGVTTVAANLALRASELMLGPVLLVEAAMGGSRLTKLWRLSPGPGLAQLLSGEASYADCVQAGPAPDLSVLPSGPLARGEVGLVEPGAVEALLAEACTDHRLVIFDLPAAEQLQQMLLLARQLDQALLVVRSEATREREAQRVADRLIEDGVPLSGAVLNRQRSYVPRWLKRWM